MSDFIENNSLGAIAIIGMNGRFPGARDLDEFWRNLSNGIESVKFFNRDELLKMGLDEHLLDNPKFVAADAILDDMDLFDASFFDYSAREAEIMDPQHRLFLESAWEVMESAGYNSELYNGRVAVYAGANLSGYMIRNLYSNPGLVENVGTFKIMIANSQDFLATKVSYKMNLMGPSVNVITLCSSSVVATHMACQSLMNYNCDLAIAGGVSFQISRNEAFFYQEGGIGSSDGHCRAFDSKANGTVSGSGLAVIVLKRLEDALADGDYIHAVIRGVGINNDGSSKNSYTAPNVDGQAECIAEAIALSGVDPETITYIDAHGTGTDLGDPIEIAALTKAFRAYTQKKQFCAIGSVKTNIGHLVTAGGLASLIKTVLAMKHKVIPPSLNFEEPNPKIDFLKSPFYVNTLPKKWETGGGLLRAGVSSFGIGGTNTHVILEEAPPQEPSEKSHRPRQLITFSAKTETALEKMTTNLSEYVKKNPDLSLADIAFTLQVGRRNFSHRRMLVCRDLSDLAVKLETMPPDQVFSRYQKPKEQPVVFMFPGEDQAYVNMGLDIYRGESSFSELVDQCSGMVESDLGFSINRVIYPDKQPIEGVNRRLNEAITTRAATFIIEYALAKLWLELEVEPQLMLGEGVGEIVAACLADVLPLEDALRLAVAKEDTIQKKAKQITFNPAKIPFISNFTGDLIEGSEASNPEYWLLQRQRTQFNQGLRTILADPDQILVEIGPGNKLNTQAKGFLKPDTEQTILTTMPGADAQESAEYYLWQSLGLYWLAGGRVNWNKLYIHEKRRRIPLPTYPFERQRYWIEPGKRNSVNLQPEVLISNQTDINNPEISSIFNEGKITITLKLDPASADVPEQQRKQLESLLRFKDNLDEFCKGFSNIAAEMNISSISLKSDEKTDLTFGAINKLQKRPRPDLETAYCPPRNDAEKVITEKWQEVLGFDRIGVHDDFFALGGHSLIAAAVATELSKVFNVQIPLRKLFETTTPAGIAELIETYLWITQDNQETAVIGEDIDRGTI